MGLTAPIDSDPVAAEVNGDTARQGGDTIQDSQTASEYVNSSNAVIMWLLI